MLRPAAEMWGKARHPDRVPFDDPEWGVSCKEEIERLTGDILD